MFKPNYQALRPQAEEYLIKLLHQFQLIRLSAEQVGARLFGQNTRPRVITTACWAFPIYSQTFVYQEITQLMQNGFDVRFLYSKLNPSDHLPSQFSPLWHNRRRLFLHGGVGERDYAYFQDRMPEKTEKLVKLLCKASGMSSEELQSNTHFLQGFSFARMVESYKPDYIHSYFFYEGSLFALIASFLLDIPRGVSCYADHMLKDYALKLVPLHLEQCDIVIATSHHIKQELLGISPHVDPDRIIVKPNAINSAEFSRVSPVEPEKEQPYQLICVSRIEPKKGLTYLVEAVRLLRDRNLNVELHLVGGVDDSDSSKDYARRLENRIHELELEEKIHLHGRGAQSDIKRLFSASHVFAAPFVVTEYGDKDGIPTSLLEAMASGLPVVATDAGSICEVIEDGRDGIIVPQKDSNALATTIADLLNDPERRMTLGNNAAWKVREKFDVKVCEHIFHNRLSKVLAFRREELPEEDKE
jgi:glycosyltransferase involved in cell wall biosynthesis